MATRATKSARELSVHIVEGGSATLRDRALPPARAEASTETARRATIAGDMPIILGAVNPFKAVHAQREEREAV